MLTAEPEHVGACDPLFSSNAVLDTPEEAVRAMLAHACKETAVLTQKLTGCVNGLARALKESV